MSKYQCHNRDSLRDSAWVQSGWSEIGNYFGSPSRMPLMVKIPDPMSKLCVYQSDKKDDPKCKGCRWMGAAEVVLPEEDYSWCVQAN